MRSRRLAEIATSGAAAVSGQLPEGEPLSDGVGRVPSRVIAEPAGQDEAGSPGKYERDLAHRLSPLARHVANLAREHDACLRPVSSAGRRVHAKCQAAL